MAAKKKGVDSSKFEGNGISFKAKLIGKEDVAEARGDLLCQEAITKLKNAAKTSGQHKQKIYVNVTLEGLKIIDAVALIVLHTHPVHRISFISRDTTDNRAFGYIVGSGDGEHTFFAIKTAAAAEQLVLTLRDLFQVVYEMKKKEVDDAKEKLEGGETPKEGEETSENSKPSGDGSTSEEGQGQTQKTTPAPAAEADGIYHVPPNNAPVNGSLAEQQANLLDLEDQADSILKGIEQIKNLEFDSITNDGDKSPASPPMSPPAVFKPGTADPWAVPAAAAPTSTPAATSSLGDLAGIQTGPFVNMQQPFPGASFPVQQMPGQQMPGYNVGAPGFNMGNPGLPVTRDPFGNDPFSAAKFQQQQQQQGVRPGFGAAPAFGNPFGGNAAFGQQPFQPGMVRAPMPGMFPGGGPPAANMNQNPFAANSAAPQEDPNLLKPIRNDQQGESAAAQQSNDGSKSPKEDLFGDLLGIKKSTSAALTPKDMFAQLNSADKKSMNELKMPPKASFDDSVWDPFLNEGGNVSEDKRRGLIPSEGEDPFNTSHIPFLPPSSTVPPPQVPPPLPQRVLPSSSQNQQPMNKNKSDDKLQPPPSSSTSSLSSSSSLSPSSSSSSSSKPPSSLIPPPPPSRVKNNPSPSSLPTPLLLLSNDDNNNNTSGKPSDVSTPFVLPSPDEPPPPLPQDFIKSPVAPPPPPRPSSSKSLSSLSSSSNTPRSEQSSPSSILSTPNPSQPSSQSQHTLSSSSSLSLSPSSSFSDPQSKPSSRKPSKRSKNMLKYDLSFTSDVSTDPFSVPLKSSSSNHNEDSSRKKNSINSDSPKDSFDQSFDFISHRTPEKQGASFVHKDSSESSPVILNNLQHNSNNNNNASPDKTGHDVDPFGLPLHLTPGFKAVARFGNDPFEDSFGAASNANVPEQDLLAKWDPFPDTPSPFDKPSTASSNLNSSDPWNNGFGDAFAPPN